MAARVLRIRFGREDFLAQRANAEKGGLFLPVPDPPPEPFAEIDLVVEGPEGALARIPVRVVHLAPGSGMALAFADAVAAREALAPIFARAGGEAGAAAPDAGMDNEAPRAEEPGVEAPDTSDADGTLLDRIRAMSTPERIRLAQHGDRAERLLLMKDPNKVIHTFLVQNPRITTDEVRYLASNRQANPDALRMIAEHREWVQNPGIVSALVGNPKTPVQTALKLMDKLPLSELRRIAKSDSHPRAVTMAARRKVLG
jgi:hypothetical protein